MFRKAIASLPTELSEAMRASEIADAGLLMVHPMTHWKVLGLRAETRSTERALSNPPLSLTPTVSSLTSPSCPLCLPSVVSCSLCMSSAFLSSSACLSSGPVVSGLIARFPTDPSAGSGFVDEALVHCGRPDRVAEQTEMDVTEIEAS